MAGCVFLGIFSELCGFAGEVFLYHKRYLKGDCVIEFAKVEPRELSYLFKTVNQSVAVYEELS